MTHVWAFFGYHEGKRLSSHSSIMHMPTGSCPHGICAFIVICAPKEIPSAWLLSSLVRMRPLIHALMEDALNLLPSA